MCLILVLTDQPLSGQSLGNVEREIATKVLCLVVTLLGALDFARSDTWKFLSK